jgi:hypothetical protein
LSIVVALKHEEADGWRAKGNALEGRAARWARIGVLEILAGNRQPISQHSPIAVLDCCADYAALLGRHLAQLALDQRIEWLEPQAAEDEARHSRGKQRFFREQLLVEKERSAGFVGFSTELVAQVCSSSSSAERAAHGLTHTPRPLEP